MSMQPELRSAPRSAWVVLGQNTAAPLAAALNDAGWNVQQVHADLHGVFSLLGQGTPLPDLVVCELHFEDGDGLQLTRVLGGLPQPPAVFYASRQQRAVIKAAISLAAACRVRVAGYCETPEDAAIIVRDLETFIAAAPAKPRTALPLLSRYEASELLRKGRLEGWVQPQMRLSTSEVVGFECLMRARDESGALITPDRLVPVLCANGLIEEATLEMARQTVAVVAECLMDGMAVSGSINVSMASLSDRAFCRELARVTERAQLDPSWMTVEITESDAMADLATVIENTTRIRMLGFNIAIDDFGTGYSSLYQLSQIPFSELKIERLFVANADADPRKRAIVQACAQLAAALDLKVVAEGVETVEELAVVRAAGCTEVQGFLVARPQPAAQALQWLRSLELMRVGL
jgi:EAL domain-containing protein (putative c-di-GMP-specific phosphodiesterase class I)